MADMVNVHCNHPGGIRMRLHGSAREPNEMVAKFGVTEMDKGFVDEWIAQNRTSDVLTSGSLSFIDPKPQPVAKKVVGATGETGATGGATGDTGATGGATGETGGATGETGATGGATGETGATGDNFTTKLMD